MDEQQFLVLRDSANIDVLDENLYCYDSAVFTLTPAIQKKASNNLLRKVEQFIEAVPAMQKAACKARRKTEYIPRLDLLSEEIKQALQDGTVEMIPCKDSTDAFFLQIRTTVKGLMMNGKEYGLHKKIKDIPLGTKTVPVDIAGAMRCLSMQNQLSQITAGLVKISEACEFNFGRIIQGQRDDRLAKLLSSRSCFIQALAISDQLLQRQLLIQAIRDANFARAELAFQIKSDIILFGDKTSKRKDSEKAVSDINIAVITMNNAVQLSLQAYQFLGEHNAQISIIKEHETFIKQVLLKEIEYRGKNQIAWDVICSSGNGESVTEELLSLPMNLIDSCVSFMENKNVTQPVLLEDKPNEGC